MDKLEWQAYEFEQPERHHNWFYALWILAVAFVAVALILNSYLLAMFILLSGGVVHIYALKQPQLFTFTLTAENLTIGSKVYNLADFDSFWIFEREDGNFLSLEAKKVLSTHLGVPLGEIDPQKVRDLFSNILVEKEQEEPLTDLLARRLKF